ncbi:serine hydrolase domain-containing protein [Halegenticoccus tardaugens]|uniref:serine hydrolase domain-containing protein n=1 Tax=Halegenticoccus tardaugens TaxID=2071624 RepID=UPI00100A7CC6|nr:serine hydrolase domain-containing protein [Halegenticoccus tardaugens]
MSGVFSTDGPGKIEQLFDLHLDAGLHHGAQLAVYRADDPVVDLAGGVTGPDGEETTPDWKHVLFSCSKPYAGVCLHALVEEGALDYDDPVRDHWPEFAEPGTAKAEATVRHVLSHQSGIPHGPFDEEPTEWIDWDAAVAAMEEIEPTFEPGETAAYHALNYGFVVGELVRRASGTPIDEFARERIFEPLGMDDTHLGLPDDEPDAVATLVGFEPFDRCREPDVGLGTVDNHGAAALFNREAFHRAVIPAASATGTARDMARFYACLANGGELDGARILSAETVEAATDLQVEVERDGTLGVPRRYAMGFERGGTPWDKYGTLPPERVFGHGGLGSIVGWADPEADLSMAYVTNGIRDEFEHASRVNAMADAVRTVFG